MTKQRILDEIRRTASENGGVPLGKVRFFKATGIRDGMWAGRYWTRWSDAVREAGFAPNILNPKIDEKSQLMQLATFIRELGRYPTVLEMRMRKRTVASFPNHKVLEGLGTRQELLGRVAGYCERTDGWRDVATLCREMAAALPVAGGDATPSSGGTEDGYVYLALMKVGREKRYKIGKANLVEQRTKQVAVKLPEELELIHAISTDDAYGIEAYWHKRFAEKRRGGEWFELTAKDVTVFKRRKFM